MPRHLLPYLILTALTYLACAPGPEPRPVAEEAPPSGEETAETASKAADGPRDDVLYATSTPDETDDEEPERTDVDDEPVDRIADEPVATVYVDDQGRFVTEEGDEIDLDALDELSDDPLQGRAIEVIVPSRFGTVDEEYDLIVELIDAAEEEGAFILIVTDEEDEQDEEDDERNEEDDDRDEDEFDESDDADDDDP